MLRTASMFLLTGLGMALPAHAQIGPALVTEPWKPVPHWADTTDEPTFIDGGRDLRSGEKIDVFYWDSTGRVKLDRHDPDPAAWFGYRVLAIDIDSDVPDFARGLMDIAVVGAVKLGTWEDWTFTLIGGAGTANDMHFSNTDAIYGLGNFDAALAVDDNATLHVGVNYNGNRTLLPDVPLPYAMYRRRIDDTLSFTLGWPHSGVVWRPMEPLVLTAEYEFPVNVSTNASWYFTQWLSVFGEYRQTIDGFYIHDEDNRRLFYEWRRVAGGVRVETKWFDVRAGAGYAFDQEFSTGFDLRGLDTAAEPEDGLMFFFTIQGTF
jgi:hypothetical protein